MTSTIDHLMDTAASEHLRRTREERRWATASQILAALIQWGPTKREIESAVRTSLKAADALLAAPNRKEGEG
jgi:hypothetical protein